MRKDTERSAQAESVLLRNHLKTTSECPQSGPVIPLSSNEVVTKANAFNKKGGTAGKDYARPLQSHRAAGDGIFLFNKAFGYDHSCRNQERRRQL